MTGLQGACWTGIGHAGDGAATSQEARPGAEPRELSGRGESRKWSAERRASSIARGSRTPRKRARAASPAAQGASQAPAFLGAPLPSLFGERWDCGKPRARMRRENGCSCLGF